MDGSTTQLSVRRVLCNSDAKSVLQIGQMDFRLCKPQERSQVDLMVTDTTFMYQPELFELTSRVNEVLRPVLLQCRGSAPTDNPPASLALLVSQTRVGWSKDDITLQFDLRELEAAGDKVTGELTLSGLKFSMENSKEQLNWLVLPKIVVNKKAAESKFFIDQRVKFSWKPNLHISLILLVEEINKFRSLLPPKQPLPETPTKTTVLHLNVTDKISGHISIGEHSMKLRVPSMTAKLSHSGMSWLQTPDVSVKFNNKQILSLQSILFSAVDHSDKLTAERRRMEGGTVRENKCFVFAANLFSFTEPYQFDFHTVFFEEILGVIKWLKTKHFPRKPDGGALGRDLLINIKHFKLELSDDPFEVRLRDNYELKKDEYLESQTRLKVLEERIAEFRRKNLMFPSEKVEELLQNLKKKNAEIYIQRAKKLYSGCSPRTRLLEWELRGLEIMILADPTMHGRVEVINHLKDFDCFSPWPPDSHLDFTTLWCRWVKLEAETFTVSLRDFPQNLLDIQTLALWGKLAGAEAVPTKRAIREHRYTNTSSNQLIKS